MLLLPLIALGFASSASAASCSSSESEYVVIPSFVEPNACVPGGYFQAQDLGQTTSAGLTTTCEAQCSSNSNCAAYVGQLQTAPNGLSTGQCYYYSTPPTAPVRCADHPTVILAEQKDTAYACFASSSRASAIAFCSSYLQYGTVTSYTSTTTPTKTTTQSTITTTTTTNIVSSTTSTTTTSVSTSTSISTSTFTSLVSVTTSITVSSATTVTSTSTSTTYTTTTTTSPGVLKRAIVPTPGCIPSYEPAASISSACACLSITSTTVFSVTTAPSQTKTLSSKSTSTSITLASSILTTTSTALSTTTTTTPFTTTTLTTSTSTTQISTLTTSTIVVTATTTSISVTTIQNYFVNGGLDNGDNYSPWVATESSIRVEHDNVFGGTGALLATTDQFGDCAFNQPVSLPMSHSYTVNFYIRSVDGATCTGDFFYASSQLDSTLQTFGPSQSYTFFTFTFYNNIASSGPFQISIVCGSGVQVGFEFDSLTLVRSA